MELRGAQDRHTISSPHYASHRDVRSNPAPARVQATNYDSLVSHMSPRTSRRPVGGGYSGDNYISTVDAHGLTSAVGGAAVRNQSAWLGSLRGHMNPRGYCPPGNRPRSPSKRLPNPNSESFAASETPGQLNYSSLMATEMVRIPGPPQEPIGPGFIPNPREALPLESFDFPAAEPVPEPEPQVGDADAVAAEALMQASWREMQASKALQEQWEQQHQMQIPDKLPRTKWNLEGKFEVNGWKGATGGWDQEAKQVGELARHPGYGYHGHYGYGTAHHYRHSWERYGHQMAPHHSEATAALPPYTMPIDHSWGLGVRAYEQQSAFETYLSEKNQ